MSTDLLTLLEMIVALRSEIGGGDHSWEKMKGMSAGMGTGMGMVPPPWKPHFSAHCETGKGICCVSTTPATHTHTHTSHPHPHLTPTPTHLVRGEAVVEDVLLLGPCENAPVRARLQGVGHTRHGRGAQADGNVGDEGGELQGHHGACVQQCRAVHHVVVVLRAWVRWCVNGTTSHHPYTPCVVPNAFSWPPSRLWVLIP